MELTPELIIKHRALVEAQVKSYTKHSKTGKTFTVSAHARRAAEVRRLRQQHQKLKARYSKTLRKELDSKSEYLHKSDKIAGQMDAVMQKIHAIKPPKRRYGMAAGAPATSMDRLLGKAPPYSDKAARNYALRTKKAKRTY